MEILLQRFYFICITILLPQAFFTSEKPSVYAGFLGYVMSRGKEIYSNSRANPLSSSLRVPFAPSSMETVEKHPINPAFLRGADRLKDRLRTLR